MKPIPLYWNIRTGSMYRNDIESRRVQRTWIYCIYEVRWLASLATRLLGYCTDVLRKRCKVNFEQKKSGKSYFAGPADWWYSPARTRGHLSNIRKLLKSARFGRPGQQIALMYLPFRNYSASIFCSLSTTGKRNTARSWGVLLMFLVCPCVCSFLFWKMAYKCEILVGMKCVTYQICSNANFLTEESRGIDNVQLSWWLTWWRQ